MIRSFVFAMIWGIVVGTYSSIYVASPVLLYLGVGRETDGRSGGEVKAESGAAS